MSVKEQQRNLRHEIGRQADEAMNQMALEHRVLARQMLEFEQTVATVRASRAADLQRLEKLWQRTTWLREWIRRFESMTLLQRLRFYLTGVLTGTPPAAAEKGTAHE